MGDDSLTVLQGIYRQPRRLQSDFVRGNTHAVARLASLGLISTGYPVDDVTFFGYSWRVSLKGLQLLDSTNKENE